MPLPETLVEREIEHRRESLQRELDQAGLTLESYAESRQLSPADVEKEVADEVRRSVKARFILDQFTEQENLTVEQDDIGQYISQLAYQSGMSPDQFASQLTSSGQLAAVVSDVLRSKAADLLAERVKITDESGRKVTIGGQETGADSDETESDAASAEPEVSEPATEPAQARATRRSARAAGKDDATAKPKGRGRRGRKDGDQPDEDAAAE
jgi:trigger factor